MAGPLLPAHPPLVVWLKLETGWRGWLRALLRLQGGWCGGRLAHGRGGLADLLQRHPRLWRPPWCLPQVAELAALLPFLEGAQALEVRSPTGC